MTYTAILIDNFSKSFTRPLCLYSQSSPNDAYREASRLAEDWEEVMLILPGDVSPAYIDPDVFEED